MRKSLLTIAALGVITLGMITTYYLGYWRGYGAGQQDGTSHISTIMGVAAEQQRQRD